MLVSDVAAQPGFDDQFAGGQPARIRPQRDPGQQPIGRRPDDDRTWLPNHQRKSRRRSETPIPEIAPPTFLRTPVTGAIDAFPTPAWSAGRSLYG